MLYDRKAGTAKEISTGFDRWVGELVWSPDSQQVYVVAEERGRDPIFIASINGGIKPLITNSSNSGLTVSSNGTLAFTRSTAQWPAEVFKASADGAGVTQLTRTNADLMAQLELNPAEEFEFAGAKTPVVHTARIGKLTATTDIGRGKTEMIHGFIVKPPNFDKTKKYPMVLLIHGGPQG